MPGGVITATIGWLLQGAGILLLLGATAACIRAKSYEKRATGVILVATAALLGAMLLLWQTSEGLLSEPVTTVVWQDMMPPLECCNSGTVTLPGFTLVLDGLAANALVLSCRRSSRLTATVILASIFTLLIAFGAAVGFIPYIAKGYAPLGALVLVVGLLCACYLSTIIIKTISTKRPHTVFDAVLLRTWVLLSLAAITLADFIITMVMVEFNALVLPLVEFVPLGSGYILAGITGAVIDLVPPQDAPYSFSLAPVTPSLYIGGAICAVALIALLVYHNHLFPKQQLMVPLAIATSGMLLTWVALVFGATGPFVALIPSSAALLLGARFLRKDALRNRTASAAQPMEVAGLVGVMLAIYQWGILPKRQFLYSSYVDGPRIEWFAPAYIETGVGVGALIAASALLIALGAVLRKKSYAILGTIGFAIAALLARSILPSPYQSWAVAAGVACIIGVVAFPLGAIYHYLVSAGAGGAT